MSFTLKGAMRAFKNMKMNWLVMGVVMEERFSPSLVAMLAYPMRWFGSLARFFQRIHKTSRPRGHQLIALLLSFPCFYASDFFFQIAYLLNHRRLLRLGRECARLGGQNGALKINDLSLDFSHRLKMKEALSNVSSSLEAKNRTLNAHHINHDNPPVGKAK